MMHETQTAAPDISAVLTQSTFTAWDVALAVTAIVIAAVLSAFAHRGVLAGIRRLHGISEGAANLAARIVRYAIVLMGIGVGATFLGASIQPLLTMALIVGAVLVLALRGVSANFAAGVILQTRQPIRVGDDIESSGHIGTVRELNGRSVIIEAADGRVVHIPNALLLEAPVVNHTRLGRRSCEIEIRFVSSTHDAGEVYRAVIAATRGVKAVVTPLPCVLVKAIEQQRHISALRFWCAPENMSTTTSDVVAAVAGALQTMNVEFVIDARNPPPAVTPAAPI